MLNEVELERKLHEWPEQWQQVELTAPLGVNSLKNGAISALCASDLNQKIKLTQHTALRWMGGGLGTGAHVALKPPGRPGRPDNPSLVSPKKMKKRSIRSERGRFALIHAIAHIELNAMDLAWDIVARFCHATTDSGMRMPRSFFDGWVQVAFEEAKHFSLLQERLKQLGGQYGDLEAHDGLWEAAQETSHDLTARLAVVPLILEARGLDITPTLLRQLHEIGDNDTAKIFQIIYRDEEGHVAVGAKWFRFLCLRQGREPAEEFQHLVRKHFRGPLKPPFNELARARAGLTPGFYRTLSSAGT